LKGKAIWCKSKPPARNSRTQPLSGSNHLRLPAGPTVHLLEFSRNQSPGKASWEGNCYRDEGDIERQAMAEASRQLKEQHYSNWGGVILCVVYNAATLACLFQWGSPAMWSRVNLFTGGFLVINALWILELNRFSQKTLISTEVRREFTGVEYDPLVKERTKLLATLLPVAMNASEILIFLDYGHWHLLPALE